jgi:hypothetical protein
MALFGTLVHDHSYQTELAAMDPQWQALGENVGYGPSAGSIESAFMASPEHRANILGNYTQIGVGVAVASDGSLYIDELYRLPWSTAAPAPAPAPAAPPATAPRASAPIAATTEPPATEPPTTEPPTTEPPTEPPTTTTEPATTAPVPFTEIQTVPVAIVRPALPRVVDDNRGLALVAAACIAAVVWAQLWSVATERLR